MAITLENEFKYFFDWYNKVVMNNDYEYIDVGCLGNGVYNSKKKEALILEKDKIVLYKVKKQFNNKLGFGIKEFAKTEYREALEYFMELEKGYLEYVLSNYYDLSDCDNISIFNISKKKKCKQEN